MVLGNEEGHQRRRFRQFVSYPPARPGAGEPCNLILYLLSSQG
jgi:hypothetical protein